MNKKTELKMRELYFNLGRDDYMAMDEYLQSGQNQKRSGIRTNVPNQHRFQAFSFGLG